MDSICGNYTFDHWWGSSAATSFLTVPRCVRRSLLLLPPTLLLQAGAPLQVMAVAAWKRRKEKTLRESRTNQIIVLTSMEMRESRRVCIL